MHELIDRESMEFQLLDLKKTNKHKPNMDKLQ
jgi:hypothetical protein